MAKATAEQIDQLLPQTQCRQCGFNGCLPYAVAIEKGQAGINQCPPGGQATIDALAALVKTKSLPLNEDHGQTKEFHLAKIIEDECIGCVKCIKACPVDAIIGTAKHMHVVIDQLCTGCELCIEPCPVDCIEMVRPDAKWSDRYAPLTDNNKPYRDAARERFQQREIRLAKMSKIKEEKRQQAAIKADRAEKREYIRAAVARKMQQKSNKD